MFSVNPPLRAIADVNYDGGRRNLESPGAGAMKKSLGRFIIMAGILLNWPLANALSIEQVDERLESLSMEQLGYIQSRPENQIAPFQTDGCSGGMSDGWRFLADLFPWFHERFDNKPPWETCCIAHDRAYWRGEADNGYMKRKQADHELKACVVETGISLSAELAGQFGTSSQDIEKAFETAGGLMYQAVRIGGKPCTGLPWRWGFGWPDCPVFPAEE